MVVIVWAGWKGRTGQLWTWIYTAWPWLTAGTVFLEQKTMLPVQEAGRSMCIRMHTRWFARRTRIFSEMSQHNDSFHEEPTFVDAMKATARRVCLLPSSNPLVRADVLLKPRLHACSTIKLIFLPPREKTWHSKLACILRNSRFGCSKVWLMMSCGIMRHSLVSDN